jgi:hypothetical protein
MFRWAQGLLVLVCCVLPACSALQRIDSQNTVVRSDYSDEKLDRNRYRVSYNGAGYASDAHVDHVLLMRAAELTKEDGNIFFMIYPASYPAKVIKPQFACKFPQYCRTKIVEIFPGFQPNQPAFNANKLLKIS